MTHFITRVGLFFLLILRQCLMTVADCCGYTLVRTHGFFTMAVRPHGFE
jgi:hypothetical protein